MRTFTDEEGRAWEVVAGRESWGAIFAIFLPGHGEGEIRQTPMRASSYEEANGELHELTEAELRDLLDRSRPKDVG